MRVVFKIAVPRYSYHTENPEEIIGTPGFIKNRIEYFFSFLMYNKGKITAAN
jgi:hypothetical protein